MSVVTAETPSALPLEHILDEHERLLANRTIGLLDLGFSMDQVLVIVHINDVVHTAGDLLARGWPHDFIVGELA